MNARLRRRIVLRFPMVLIVAAAALVGCNADDAAEHDHAHDDTMLRLTGWSAAVNPDVGGA